MAGFPVKLLALDTSSAACSAALYVDGEMSERHALAPRQHATLILPMLESLLVEADMRVGDIDALAFGCGPGSFTGVRIAASVCQAVAFAAGLPVVPVSTLAALAQEAATVSAERKVLAALDARKGEVYWGQYRLSDNGLAVLVGNETVCSPAAVAAPADAGWIGAGSGWQAHGESLLEQCGDSVVRLLPDLEPHARSIALLGVAGYVNERAVAPEQALPVYLRNNVADEKR